MNEKSDVGDVMMRWLFGTAMIGTAFVVRSWAIQLAFAWVLSPVFGLPRIGLGVAWCFSIAVATIFGSATKEADTGAKDDGLRWYPKWAWSALWKTVLGLGMLWTAKTLFM